MNNINKAAVSIMHFNVIIRDTLEYTLPKPTYSLDFFQQKNNSLTALIDQPSPLSNFLHKNGENGEKLIARIKELQEMVYGPTSTICHVAGTELRVDQAQNVAVFEKVLPIHQEIQSIVDLFLNQARKENASEAEVEAFAKVDEKYYRGIVFMTLITELSKQFIEYNKLRQEAKGEKTPQSNFIEGDLGKLVGLLNFSRQYAKCTDLEYTDVLDEVYKSIDMMNGKRDFPEGVNFSNLFNKSKQMINDFILKEEGKWKEMYAPLLQELVQSTKDGMAASQAAKKDDGKDA